MFESVINVNGKEIKIRFGAYVLKCLADDGIPIGQLMDAINNNPAGLIPKIFMYGAINAIPDRDHEKVSINDIYDWLDSLEGGLLGTESTKLFNLFVKHMTMGVPKNKKAEVVKKK